MPMAVVEGTTWTLGVVTTVCGLIELRAPLTLTLMLTLIP
jgi:hypothetical protein